jgi:hypothetical protein
MVGKLGNALELNFFHYDMPCVCAFSARRRRILFFLYAMKTLHAPPSFFRRGNTFFALMYGIGALMFFTVLLGVHLNVLLAQTPAPKQRQSISSRGDIAPAELVPLFQMRAPQDVASSFSVARLGRIHEYAAEYSLLEINPDALMEIARRQRPRISIELPIDIVKTQKSLRGQEQSASKQSAQTRSHLTLERFDIFTPDAQLVAATASGSRALDFDPQSLVAYKGVVEGAQGASVTLTAAANSVYCLIRLSEDETVVFESLGHLVADEDRAKTVLQDEEQALRRTVVLYDANLYKKSETLRCDVSPSHDDHEAEEEKTSKSKNAQLESANVLECRLAVDVDYMGFTASGSEAKAALFVARTIAHVSAIYERDIQTRIVVSFLKIWTTPDAFGADLGKYQTYWNANQPTADRHLAHLLSGSGGGGVAFINGLRNCLGGYGVSRISANNFAQTIYISTLKLVAHEIGHNFGSHHTHLCVWPGGFDPNGTSIDQCSTQPGGPGSTSCFSTAVASRGAIMSYCGHSDLAFHPWCIAVMKNTAQTAQCKSLASVQVNRFTVSGKILTSGGSPVVGVSLQVGDTTVTTDNSGNYLALNRPNGSYTLVPQKTGVLFMPTSRSVTLNNSHAANADFVAGSALKVSLSGFVYRVESGVTTPLQGVPVSVPAVSASATSGANGAFSIPNLDADTYVVTVPAGFFPGYVFAPSGSLVNASQGSVAQMTFIARPTSISGIVTLSGAPLANVQITLSNGMTTMTNSQGSFVFEKLLPGSYTVTPSLAPYTFTPQNAAVTLSVVNSSVPNNGQVLNVNFAASQAGAPVTLTPPTLSVSNIQQTGFTLGWNTTQGATGYALDIALNASFTHFASGYQNRLYNATSVGQVVSGLFPGTTYYARIRAVNGANVSVYSTPLQITTLSVNPTPNPTPNPNPTPSLTTNVHTIHAAWIPITEAYMVNVSANVAWTASSDSPWITFTPASAPAGNVQMFIKVEKNMGSASRTGAVTLVGGGLTRTVTVQQDGVPALSASAENEGGALRLSISPNPSDDIVRVVAKIVLPDGEASADRQATVALADARGNIIAERLVQARDGEIFAEFDIRALKAGAYMVEIFYGDEARRVRRAEKFIKR